MKGRAGVASRFIAAVAAARVVVRGAAYVSAETSRCGLAKAPGLRNRAACHAFHPSGRVIGAQVACVAMSLVDRGSERENVPRLDCQSYRSYRGRSSMPGQDK